MKQLLRVVLVLCAFNVPGLVFAYPESPTLVSLNEFTDAPVQTVGFTQQRLKAFGNVKANDEFNGVMNSVKITQATMSAAMSCMNWEVVGICVWMTCIPFPPGCDFDTSLKVKNHVPDLLIQSYDRANGEPWTESKYINIINLGDADSSWVATLIGAIEDFNVGDVGIRGGHSTPGQEKQRANTHFKLVDAYGSPALYAFNTLANSSFGSICGGRLSPFSAYYISNLDSVAWRWNVPEMFYPQSMLPLVTQWDLVASGNINNNYGPIFPRHGFLTGQDPLKAAVLTAFRAAHFITRSGEPHLYTSIVQYNQDGYWPSGPLDKNQKATGIWQMLYPQADGSCQRFPYEANPSGNRRSTDGSYIWNFWKSYKCCERKGHQLIYHQG